MFVVLILLELEEGGGLEIITIRITHDILEHKMREHDHEEKHFYSLPDSTVVYRCVDTILGARDLLVGLIMCEGLDLCWWGIYLIGYLLKNTQLISLPEEDSCQQEHIK